jgi:predicted CXXCH cytochrome family protein
LALLFAGAFIWLFLAAIPALGDGGVHVAPDNSGYSTLTSDNCAGCHRAHTAQGPYLTKTATVEALCLSCHGAASTGATADVMTGIQYALNGSGARDAVVLGSLRNGGFDQARMDGSNPARYTYLRTATDPSFRATVRATAAVAVTSAHLALPENGLIPKDVAWGNGAAGSGAGPTVEIECTSCHNPHGNGQYRILNTLPAATGTGFVDPVQIPIASASATTNRITTSAAHGLVVGDIVTITGTVTGAVPAFSTSAGAYIVLSIANGNAFTVAATTTKTSVDVLNTVFDVTTDGSGGGATVQRYAAIVDDAPLPASGDERNYSILQVRGYQGNPDTYLLYASDVLTAVTGARAAGAFDLTVDIVGLTSTSTFTTGLAHGFAVGDTVTIAGIPSPNPGLNGIRTVATIPSSTTFTLTGIASVVTDTAGTAVGDKLGTATKSVAGSFGTTDGDYWHRAVPWNPKAINPACPYSTFSSATADVSACLTAQDAPNGRPATVTSTSTVNAITIKSSAYGQVAFNDQISAWCSTCHSRYYASANPNPGYRPVRTITAVSTAGDTITVASTSAPGFAVNDEVIFAGTTITATGYTALQFAAATWWVVSASSDGLTISVSSAAGGTAADLTAGTATGTVGWELLQGSSAVTAKAISSAAPATEIITSASHSFAVGDQVQFSGTAPAPLVNGTTYYVVEVPSSTTFKVSVSYDGPVFDITATGTGTVIRSAPANAAAWYFPRPGEGTYKFQHRTQDNRSCVTCHVSHGTSAVMSDPNSDTLTYPDGSAATAGNSRLLKIENRGTCQMCHDPTGTATAGQLLPLTLLGVPPTVP